MGIILIDSSSKKIEFGFAINNKLLFSETLAPDDNADSLAYYIRKAFKKNNLKFDEIEYVSLSNGPGSFTGLRIGSAVAKGICFAKGSKFIEIPTLDIIGMKVLTDKDSKLISKRIITSLISANMKVPEFYFCKYEIEANRLKRVSEYKTDIPEKIFDDNSLFIINENVVPELSEKFYDRIINVSTYSNIKPQLDLTLNHIREERFNNYNLSEPFYMKEFVPKI